MTSQRLLIKYIEAICKDPFPCIPITSIAMMLPWGIHRSLWWVQHWKNPPFMSSPFLYWFPRLEADDLVSGNQVRLPRTSSRKLEWQSRHWIQSILEKAVATPFTPESGVAEAAAVTASVLTVSVTHTEVSVHGEAGASPLECLWSPLELSSLEPILHAALAGLL